MKFLQDKARLMKIGGGVVCVAALGVTAHNILMPHGGGTMTDAMSEAAIQEVEVTRTDAQPLTDPAVVGEVTPISTPVELEIVDPDTADVQINGAGALDLDVILLDPLDLANGVIEGETPATPEPVELAALETDDTLPAPQVEAATPALVCEITATGEAASSAMVEFDLTAPCLPNERFVVHHNGMMFSAATDDAGSAKMMVPALSQTAVIIAEFANGEGAVAMTEVPSIAFYDRVVLQWSGDAGFQLHAREFGAGYGEDGHVWSGAARDAATAALGDGGFVTRLGMADGLTARMAEVYTFPTATTTQTGDIALSVEAEITTANCGTDVDAQALELSLDGTIRTQELTLSVAGCDAIGDFLVLNNLVNDLKIAAN